MAAGCPAPCKAPTCLYRAPQVAARLPAEVALQQALFGDRREAEPPPLRGSNPLSGIILKQSERTEVGPGCQSPRLQPPAITFAGRGAKGLLLEYLSLQMVRISASLNPPGEGQRGLAPATLSFRVSHKLQLGHCSAPCSHSRAARSNPEFFPASAVILPLEFH